MKTVYLNDICNFEKGSTGLAKAIPGKYPLVATGANRRSCNSFQLDTKAVCIPLVSSTGHGHASLKNVHYQEGKFALGSILVALTAKNEEVLNIQFLHLYLSELKDKILVPLMSGAANVALSVTKIKSVEIPLPPINRQKEIVINFKSIVAEENELKAELTHQQTLLKKLRQQILQEAIEGKLTADWREKNPDVEPASELLIRIQAEKQQLINDKKIKKQKPLPPISKEEKPFELPDGWAWCRLGEISLNFQNGISSRGEGKGDAVTVLRLADINLNMVDLSNKRTIQLLSKTYERHLLNENDILITRVNGSLGLVGNFNYVGSHDEKLTPCDHFVKLSLPNKIYSYYVFLTGGVSHIRAEIENKFKTTSGQKTVNQGHLSNLLIPLPSLLEQKAIVVKVEKLLTVCNQLETQIAQNQTHAKQLMQAVLKEAFSQA